MAAHLVRLPEGDWVMNARGSEPIWSVQPPRYVIEGWSRNGEAIQSFERSAEWFAPHDGAVLDDDDRPLPYVRAFHEDRNGLLWTVVWVPAFRWEEGSRQGEGLHGEPALVVSDLTRLYDSVVEVVDPAARTVLASARFPHRWHTHLSGDGLLGRADVDQDAGTLRLVVLDLSLEGSC